MVYTHNIVNRSIRVSRKIVMASIENDEQLGERTARGKYYN